MRINANKWVQVYSQEEAALYSLPGDEVFTLQSFRNGPEPSTLDYPSFSAIEWQNLLLAIMIVVYGNCVPDIPCFTPTFPFIRGSFTPHVCSSIHVRIHPRL